MEPYGILITAGDNDTFPLWYAQEVEGVRPDVTLANLSLMNTRWHLRQLRRRPMPEYDVSKSVALWGSDASATPAGGTAVQKWTRPTEPVFGFTEAQLDSLPEYMQVKKGAGSAWWTACRSRFGADYLMLQDLAVVALIRQNLGKRPIYFSWSDGGYPDQTLGLGRYLVTQGMVRKLMTVTGHHDQRFPGGQPGAGPDGLPAHREPPVERVPLEGDRAAAAARLGRSAVSRRSCSCTRCSIAAWRRRCAAKGDLAEGGGSRFDRPGDPGQPAADSLGPCGY